MVLNEDIIQLISRRRHRMAYFQSLSDSQASHASSPSMSTSRSIEPSPSTPPLETKHSPRPSLPRSPSPDPLNHPGSPFLPDLPSPSYFPRQSASPETFDAPQAAFTICADHDTNPLQLHASPSKHDTSSQSLPSLSQMFDPRPPPAQLNPSPRRPLAPLASITPLRLSEQRPIRRSPTPPDSYVGEMFEKASQASLPSDGVRRLRARKGCQLKPYTIEQTKYITALEETDWQDAVVKLKHPRTQISTSETEEGDEGQEVDYQDENAPPSPSGSSSSVPSSQIGQFCQRSFKRRRRASSERPRRPNRPRFRDEPDDSDAPRGPSTSRRQSSSARHNTSVWHPDIPPRGANDLFRRGVRLYPIAQNSRTSSTTPLTRPPTLLDTPATSLRSHPSPSSSHSKFRRISSSSPKRSKPRCFLSEDSISPDARFRLEPNPRSNQIVSSWNHAAKSHQRNDRLQQRRRRASVGSRPSASQSTNKKQPAKQPRILDLTLPSPPTAQHRSTSLNSAGAFDGNSRFSRHQISNAKLRLNRAKTRIAPEDEVKDDEREDETDEEENEEEDEEEDGRDDEGLLKVLSSKAQLKLLRRMMPRSYVKLAEKDMVLMKHERQFGRVRLTAPDSDQDGSSGLEGSNVEHRQTRTSRTSKPARLPTRRISISPPRRFELDQSGSSETERPGIPWADKVISRVPSAHRAQSPEVGFDHRNDRNPAYRSSSVDERRRRHAKKSRLSEGTSFDPVVSLKDDHALWRTQEASNGLPSLNLAPPACRALRGRPTSTFHPDIIPSITAFKDFTPDFSIERLKPELRIRSETSYIRDGHLSELLDVLQDHEHRHDESQDVPCEVLGRSFVFSMSASDFLVGLIDFADVMQDELNAWLALDHNRTVDALCQTCRAFEFFGQYVSRHRPTTWGTDNLTEEMREWINELIQRLDDLALDSINRPGFSELMLGMSWGLLELACRLYARAGFEDLVECTTRHLIRRLLEFGPPQTVCRLKAANGPVITDVSIEVWVSLINVVVIDGEPTRRASCLLQSRFWDMLMAETTIFSQKSGLTGVVAEGEAQAYMAMALCALSQFSPSGIVDTDVSRLDAHWSVILDVLASLPDGILAEPVQRVAAERRDCYLRALFGRILLFHQRWGWRLVFDDGMLERLYKLLNGLKLQQLGYEAEHSRFGGPHALPEILIDTSAFHITQWGAPEGLGGLPLRKEDTCFGIFLKLIVASATALQWPLDSARALEVERIVSRCNPLRQLAFPSVGGHLGQTDESIGAQARSALVHHCSLFLVYVALFPRTLRRQFSFLERLYNFERVDRPSRLSHLVIWSKAAELLPWGNCQPAAFVRQFALPMTILSNEFAALLQRELAVRDRVRGLGNVKGGREKEAIENELASVVEARRQCLELVERLLRALRESFDAWNEVESKRQIGLDHGVYPDVFWLDPAWTMELPKGLVFREGSVAKLANEMICAFFNLRDLAVEDLDKLKTRLNEYTSQEADEDDYDDRHNLTQQVESLDRRERGLAEMIEERVIQPVCRYLVWLGSRASTSELAQGMIETVLKLTDNWARADGVRRRVGVSVSSWSSRLVIKDDNARVSLTIQDETMRVTIGMKYMLRTLDSWGSRPYAEIRQEALMIWFAAIVGGQLTIQMELTQALVKVEEEVFPLGLIEMVDGLDKREFERIRMDIVKEVIKKFILDGESVERRKYLGVMVEAMSKTNGELRRRRGRDPAELYVEFVIRVFLREVQVEGSWIKWESVPKLRMLKTFY